MNTPRERATRKIVEYLELIFILSPLIFVLLLIILNIIFVR